MHADQLDGVRDLRGHQGVRVAVAEGEYVEPERLVERVVGAAGSVPHAVERRVGRLEGRILVHADKLDGVVQLGGHQGVRVAVAEGECLHMEGILERREDGPVGRPGLPL